ncbi:MAG: protoporphyrinogen oxidase [Rothia sp. (in: high G+C Gram-positive bacteria)]|nr:protoporphyrinogen oxidase [Rothia sp. (in: high G+C Gram-positive bacteria)]
MALDSRRSPRESAVVVGGGISGLLAARELAQRGLRVTLVERRHHLGGSVGAHEVAGHVLDSGAESFATRTPAVADLLTDLGIAEKICQPSQSGSWLYLQDGAYPAPKTGILGIPGNLNEPSVKNILGSAGIRRAKLDKILPASAGANAVTLGELVRKRMGSQVLDRLVAPVTTGVHSTHPDHLELDSVVPGMRAALAKYGSLVAASASLRAASPAGAQVAGLVGGMNQLSEALVDDVLRRRVRILTGYDAIAVDRDVTHGGWTLLQRQPKLAERAAPVHGKYLVMATDGPTTARILGSHLDEKSIPQINPGHEIALVTLVIDQAALDSHPRGTGLLVSDQVASVRAKALTHASAKWTWIADELGPGKHVVRLSYGRGNDAGPLQEVALYDDQLITLAMHDASKLLGVSVSRNNLLGADVVRWKGSLPTAAPGHREKVADFRRALEELDGVSAVGAWLAGNGLAAVTADTKATLQDFAERHHFSA